MASKRLIKELNAYNREPSSAVVSLEPVSDDDLFNLRAVLRGPDETAYEGIHPIHLAIEIISNVKMKAASSTSQSPYPQTTQLLHPMSDSKPHAAIRISTSRPERSALIC